MCPHCGMNTEAPAPALADRYRRPGPGQARCSSGDCGAIVAAATLDRRGRCRRCQRIAASARVRKRKRRYRARRRALSLMESPR